MRHKTETTIIGVSFAVSPALHIVPVGPVFQLNSMLLSVRVRSLLLAHTARETFSLCPAFPLQCSHAINLVAFSFFCVCCSACQDPDGDEDGDGR